MSTILVVSNQVVSNNSKINWPDLNYPGSGQTILRTLHRIDYETHSMQLDDSNGPIFNIDTLPLGVGFYKQLTSFLQDV